MLIKWATVKLTANRKFSEQKNLNKTVFVLDFHWFWQSNTFEFTLCMFHNSPIRLELEPVPGRMLIILITGLSNGIITTVIRGDESKNHAKYQQNRKKYGKSPKWNGPITWSWIDPHDINELTSLSLNLSERSAKNNNIQSHTLGEAKKKRTKRIVFSQLRSTSHFLCRQ